MPLCLSHGFGTRVNKMSNGSITTYENKLMECGACATCFKQPEHAFYCHIHNLFGSFFNRCQMKNMCHAVHCFFHNFAMFNRAMNILYSFVRLQLAVMT